MVLGYAGMTGNGTGNDFLGLLDLVLLKKYIAQITVSKCQIGIYASA